MTVVDVFRDKEGLCSGFMLRGHADDDAVEGEDVICSAISVLVFNAVNSLQLLAKADISCYAAEEGGELSCRFDSPPDENATLLVESMLLGLRSVQESYGGEYLSVNIHEES